MALTQEEPKFIVAIGTSAGGIRALEELVMQLGSDTDAAYFVVIHLSRKGVGEVLFQRLQQHSVLPCKVAKDGDVIQTGNIYLAPPDHHMLLDKGHIVIGKGAPENRWRPSINNLFRSAAAHYSSRVIGIILTGLLDDGMAGMGAIKRAGGIAMVQNPAEADYPDMPLSIINNMEVDYITSLSRMGEIIREVVETTEPKEVEVPFDIVQESEIDQRVSTRIENLKHYEKLDINCPDCGGGLYVTQKEPAHVRCHVGHSYTERELLSRIAEVMESTFWTALRIMEERRALLLKMAKRDEDRGYTSTSEIHFERARELDEHIENLKKILFSTTHVD
jgi:two-component system chemotaxis response regulator CheB